MWRVFNCVSRGARSVKPSQCCAQDNADEAAKNSYQCESPAPSPIRHHAVVRHHTYCKESRDLNWKYLCLRFSRCLYYKISTLGKTPVNNTNGLSRFPLVWAIPCDVYPHAQAEWKNRCEEEKLRRFLRRRQNILLTNSICNIVSWSSAATLTWTVCQFLRTYHHLCNPNSRQCNTIGPTHENRLKHDVNSTKNLDDNCSESYQGQNAANKDHYWEDGLSLRNGQKGLFTLNFHSPFHFWWVTGGQNNLEKPSERPLVVNSWATTITEQLVNLPDPNHKREEDRNPHVLANDQYNLNGLDFYREAKPQIEFDREVLETDDSGYLETTGCDSNFCAGTHEDFLICSHTTQDNVEVSSRSFQNTTTSDFLSEACTTDKPIREEVFFNSSHHLLLEEPSTKPEETDSVKDEGFLNLHPKEVVLIEDCSIEEDIRNISSGVHHPTKPPNAKVSYPRSDGKKASIGEFSDGLKEILDAGKRDLNDFSTQFLGILEGGIGRSIASEEPDAAVPYFRAGALLGDAASSFNLALCYHMGRGVEEDLKLARELYEAARLAGHGWATYNLAVMLSEGQGGPADKERALSLLSEAAKVNVKEAQMALQLMEELQNSVNYGDTVSPTSPKVERRQRLNSVASEPSLTSVLSHMWSSSYSTSDLDFVEDCNDRNIEDLSSLQMDIAEKPSFYLG